VAQPGHRLPVGLVQREVRPYGGGPVGEQRQHVVLPGHRSRVAGIRYGQRRELHRVLTGHAERLLAGGQHAQPRRRPQQRLDEHRARVDQVLASVEDQQQPFVRQVIGEQVDAVARRLVGQAEGLGHRLGDELGIAQPGQLDQPGAVGEGATLPGGDAERQPRLADAAHPGHGDEPGVFEEQLGLAQFALSPDELRHLGGQVASPPVQRNACHGRLGIALTGPPTQTSGGTNSKVMSIVPARSPLVSGA
jgi:hypothetical protein